MACGPVDAKLKVELLKEHEVGPPSPDKSRIIIIQQPKQKIVPNCGIVTRYAVDGEWLAANCSKSFAVITVAPGDHHLCGERQTKLIFRGRAEAFQTLHLEGGKTYYFKTYVDVQAPADSSLDLQPADEAEAKFVMSRFEEARLKQ